MILETEAPPRAFAVRFDQLQVWSVSSFTQIKWQWPEEYIRPLSAALHRRVEEVNRQGDDLEDLQLVTLHFDGSMEPRNGESSRNFKGRLFRHCLGMSSIQRLMYGMVLLELFRLRYQELL